jgi:hypothetical protein
MIKTQIQLENEQYQQLRKIGSAESKGLAEQVREAVGLYLAKRRTDMPSLEELAAGFQPLPPESFDELKPLDHWLADAIRDSKRQ